MNHKKTLALCMALGLILGNYQAFAQTAEELLSKGIQLEEVKGELEKAIEVYQTIVDKFSDNRPIAAKALLHIGLCYEKLGLKQAKKAFQDVINKYPEQKNEVALAKERVRYLKAYVADISKKAEQHLKKGNELFSQWEYESAIEEYKNAIKFDPNTLLAQNARYCIGQSWFRAGRYDTALATFKKLIEEFPESNITPVTELMVAQVEYAMDNNKNPEMVNDYSDENIIIDPETGISYTKIKTFTGKNDLIRWTPATHLSPNGKFLIISNTIVPMDGSDPFEFIDMQVGQSSWSPEGNKVAFRSREDSSIYIVPVSPETGHTEGPAKNLLSGIYNLIGNLNWSPDSKKIFFSFIDKKDYHEIWSLSISDGMTRPLANATIPQIAPACSPDGTTIAFQGPNADMWLCPSEGGTPWKFIDRRHTFPSWSPDGKWLFSDEAIYNWGRSLNFIRLSDKLEFKVNPPEKVGSYLSWPPEGKKVLFFRSSYKIMWGMKVASGSGGPSCEPVPHLPVYGAQWSKNSKMIIVDGEEENQMEEGDVAIRIVPIAGGESFLLDLDNDVDGKPRHFRVSPDQKYLLFEVVKENDKEDFYIAPISIEEARVNGPAIRIIENWSYSGGYGNTQLSWSPDGTKLALNYKENIWVYDIDKMNLKQITKTPEKKKWIAWSPNSRMLSYWIFVDKPDWKVETRIIPSEGGDPIKIFRDLDYGLLASSWSPDSKSVAALSNGKISIRNIKTNETRIILDVKTQGLDDASNFCWSPDGENLVFVGIENAEPINKNHLYRIPAKGGKLTELATGDLSVKYDISWSPDGKWICYLSYKLEKIRPESTMWEANFEEIKEKLLK